MEGQRQDRHDMTRTVSFGSTPNRDARRMDIFVARVVAETLRSTLGPKGSKKLLVNQSGDVIVTSDGATILRRIHVAHPVAKMMVDIAKTQEAEVGDGTTTAVVLTGELLKRAEHLMDQGVHPVTIARGYRIAGQQVSKLLSELSMKISFKDSESLKRVAVVALNSKTSIGQANHLAEIAIRAVKHVTESVPNRKHKVATQNIKIVKQVGRSIRESEVIQGLVIETDERIPKSLSDPTLVRNAKVAVIDADMGLRRTKTEARIDIASTEQLQSFYKETEDAIDKVKRRVLDSGANVVFNFMTIDERLMHLLAQKSVLSVKTVPEKDLEKIALATGAKIVKNLDELNPSDLGAADKVEIRKVADSEFIFITGCENPKAATLFLRGGTVALLDELEGSMDDAIGVLRDTVEEPAILPGGGATEIEVAMKLRKYAKRTRGREQLAVAEYANALESIPKTLAENAGLEPIDIMPELRMMHQAGKENCGINLRTGRPDDMIKSGILEPLKVKRQAMASATEAAIQILRVSDVVSSKPAHEEPKHE
jgi:thermosome